MANNPQAERFRTSVGGQALMEGIMMRGPQKICCAVRRPDGEIDLSYDAVTTHWYNKVPLVRGICNMAENLYSGYKYLMHSADISLTEEEKEADQSKFEKWLDEHTTPAVQNVLMTCAAFAGVLLALFLFTFLPTFLTGAVGQVVTLSRWPKVILEGVFKLVIFLAYMFLCTRMKEIHRMFEYHGAEHKTIACYEAGLELTVDNVRTRSRLHPRCGTSFLFMVMLISILFFSLFSWSNVWVRTATRLAMLPVVAGVSYEINRFAGRHDNWLTGLLRAPGLALQRMTTAEPTDDMMEVAIEAMNRVIPENEGEDNW